MDLLSFENLFAKKVQQMEVNADPAHDFLHFKRVAHTAKKLCLLEGGQMEVVLPAAWLHDMVVIPKNDPKRSQASRLSAEAACQFLKEIEYPQIHMEAISHAIAAHSFSAQIQPETLEAKIVQDADRLDGLGAIGVARCFATAGLLRRPFYSEQDPFCHHRLADDGQFTIDHFYKKLFIVAETLQTASGQKEGRKRLSTMKDYLVHFQQEMLGYENEPQHRS